MALALSLLSSGRDDVEIDGAASARGTRRRRLTTWVDEQATRPGASCPSGTLRERTSRPEMVVAICGLRGGGRCVGRGGSRPTNVGRRMPPGARASRDCPVRPRPRHGRTSPTDRAHPSRVGMSARSRRSASGGRFGRWPPQSPGARSLAGQPRRLGPGCGGSGFRSPRR